MCSYKHMATQSGAIDINVEHSSPHHDSEAPTGPSLDWDYGSIKIDRLRNRSSFYAKQAGASQDLIGELDVPSAHAQSSLEAAHAPLSLHAPERLPLQTHPLIHCVVQMPWMHALEAHWYRNCCHSASRN